MFHDRSVAPLSAANRYLARPTGLAVAALVICLGAEASQPQSRTLVDLLAEAQQLLQAGKTQLALDLLEKARTATAELEKAQLYLQEELHWQVAMAQLDFADQLTNDRQIKAIASRARDLWKEYVEWYDGLSVEERKQLPPNHDRIHSATRFLGNAGVRMRQLSQVLTDYEMIQDVMYLGPDAIDLWKSTLYRCPDWTAVGDRTAVRAQKVCTEACTNAWLAYAETLHEWAQKFRLREAVRQRLLREGEQIQSIAQQCPPAAGRDAS